MPRNACLAFISCLACLACTSAPERAPRTARPGPNIVVVVIDDLRWDEFGAAGHPWIETPNIDRLAREGALFANAFHAVPLCSPNRATLLTGQFPSQHGIIDNLARNLLSHRLQTFPATLREHGYETAFLGKWHMGNDPAPRPGFDYWVGLPGQGRSIDPELFDDGTLRVVRGYTTDLLTDRAVAFIQRPRTKPFLVYLAHKAVHPDVQQRDDGSVADPNPQYIPAPRHRGRYDDRALPRRPNVLRTLGDPAGATAVRRALASSMMTHDQSLHGGDVAARGTSDTTIWRRAEMILAIDEGLGRIFAALEAKGELDRTVVVLTSDNGFFFGEHGLTTERRLPYEESIRNPLLVRYPPLVPGGSRPAQLALTVDIAPTLLELAGAPISDRIQGHSLVPVLRGDPAPGWRSSILVEFYANEQPFPHLMDMDYRALRTSRYKYVHWIHYPALDELYDLETDPYEMRNLAREPSAAAIRTRLRAELGREVLGALGL